MTCPHCGRRIPTLAVPELEVAARGIALHHGRTVARSELRMQLRGRRVILERHRLAWCVS